MREVLDRFGNSLPLAAAAYNAGPHRVDEWLADNGDPRVGPIDMVDWIELIPFNETRNYVQKVLVNTMIYAALDGRTGVDLKSLLRPVSSSMPADTDLP
jgi:soluble lytic murein transglycosylase